MSSQTGQQMITIHILLNKFGQLIKYDIHDIIKLDIQQKQTL